ncbi:uncharacterized protein VTP21DRAFT_4842 [Calcarisporiella thermophila]|uniref:uncharacterized protein n=1 Tax=Calcarisporiella thermophila TaxID=911321 RepID=UPI0037438B42
MIKSYFKTNKGKAQSKRGILSPEPSSPTAAEHSDDDGLHEKKEEMTREENKEKELLELSPPTGKRNPREPENLSSPELVSNVELQDPFVSVSQQVSKKRKANDNNDGTLIYSFRGRRVAYRNVDDDDDGLSGRPRVLWPSTSHQSKVLKQAPPTAVATRSSSTRFPSTRPISKAEELTKRCLGAKAMREESRRYDEKQGRREEEVGENDGEEEVEEEEEEEVDYWEEEEQISSRGAEKARETTPPHAISRDIYSPDNPFVVTKEEAARIKRDPPPIRRKPKKGFGVVFRGKHYPVSEEALFGDDSSPFQSSIGPRYLLPSLLAAKKSPPPPSSSSCAIVTPASSAPANASTASSASIDESRPSRPTTMTQFAKKKKPKPSRKVP